MSKPSLWPAIRRLWRFATCQHPRRTIMQFEGSCEITFCRSCGLFLGIATPSGMEVERLELSKGAMVPENGWKM